jgi:hypothetical protein
LNGTTHETKLHTQDPARQRADHDCTAGRDRLRRRWRWRRFHHAAAGGFDADGNANGYAHTNADGYPNQDANSNPDTYAYTKPYTNAHSKPLTDG